MLICAFVERVDSYKYLGVALQAQDPTDGTMFFVAAMYASNPATQFSTVYEEAHGVYRRQWGSISQMHVARDVHQVLDQ